MKNHTENTIVMPFADDFHCHLRQNEMLDFTVNAVKIGGCNRILVMPNTIPIISTCKEANEYRQKLMKHDDTIEYLMTLYLNENTNEQDIIQGYKECNLQGIKVYPSNVTTNSDKGVTSLEPYYRIFSCLEKINKSVHIHCEESGINPLFAEKEYLHHIHDLAIKFPHLRIVLEHISTEESVKIIKQFHNVAGTITPHHLYLTMEDVINTKTYDYHIHNTDIVNHVTNVFNFCKPLVKRKEDRDALQKLIIQKFPRVFLGSDSAPHYKEQKEKPHCKAGIYTQPFLMPYIAHIFNKLNSLDMVKPFCCTNGATFLNLKKKELVEGEECLCIEKKKTKIPMDYFNVVPFLAGKEIDFSISYKTYEQ